MIYYSEKSNKACCTRCSNCGWSTEHTPCTSCT